VGDDEAQEGRRRRQARQDVRQADQERRGRRAHRRRRPRRQPDAVRRHPEGEEVIVPNDNIDRAVKRGSGAEAGGAEYQTITYEGYGPNGVAVLVECLTDNRNRAASEVRVAMTRNGGHDGRPRLGVLPVQSQGRRRRAQDGRAGEDDVLGAVLEAGAEEVNDLGEAFEVVSEAGDLVAVRTALQAAGIDYDSADPTFLPSVTVPLDEDGARKVFRLIEALEDSDEVQNVYANYDVSDDILEAVG
jgi:YebC/PmpR family DNA-binding regulatory protein